MFLWAIHSLDSQWQLQLFNLTGLANQVYEPKLLLSPLWNWRLQISMAEQQRTEMYFILRIFYYLKKSQELKRSSSYAWWAMFPWLINKHVIGIPLQLVLYLINTFSINLFDHINLQQYGPPPSYLQLKIPGECSSSSWCNKFWISTWTMGKISCWWGMMTVIFLPVGSDLMKFYPLWNYKVLM